MHIVTKYDFRLSKIPIFRMNFPSTIYDGKFNRSISILQSLKLYLVTLQYA